jgi:hypothetical protein
MIRNKIEVKSTDNDGKEVTVYVIRPNSRELTDAQIVAGGVLKNALDNKALLRSQLREYMVQNGMWDEKKEERLEKIDAEIVDALTKIKKGGMKLNEGKELALKIKANRIVKLMLEASRRQLDEYTAESQAENARFDYLVSVCTKNEKGERVFESLEDYNARADEPFAKDAASKLASIVHGYDPDWEKKLPENQFLLKYKLVDENLRLVNKDGHFVTSDGKVIDENYNYVDGNGNIVDENGVLLDSDGLPKVEQEPFLDDDGNPITV